MSRDPQITRLKEIAEQNMGTVLARLGVDKPPRGPYGTIALNDPMTRDTDPSLIIWTNRPGGLSWKRYGSDAQGDIINLVAYLSGWWWSADRGTRDAIAWLKDVVGFHRMTDAERAEARTRARAADAARRESAEKNLARQRAWALNLFLCATPRLDGTPAETYLRERRGIDLERLPRGPRGARRRPGFLRYLPEHRHTDESGKASTWPCLVACCVDPVGNIKAVHRTWITRDGRDKAPIRPPRKCFPSFAGLIIPVWKGGTDMSVNEAIRSGVRETLGLTEGWEDALAWAIASPDLRIWAAISLGNFGNVAPPENIDSLILHRQEDWQTRGAVEAFESVKQKFEARMPVSEIRALGGGKDISDAHVGDIRGAAA